MENFEILWKNTMRELEKNISRITYSTYIEKLKPVDLLGTTLILHTDTQLFAKQASRLSDKIIEAMKAANTGLTDFQIYVGSDNDPMFSSGKEAETISSPIDPRYTFNSFVVGNSNRYLYAAAKAVADDPGNSYNPLFIYGNSGLGKTHIMHAIANKLSKDRPDLNVLYSTCEKFTNDLINSIRSGKAYQGAGGEQFRTKYRNVDVLIIDDVQFLAKKQSTQEEFFHTFNELYGKNKQIILSADCPPKDIELLEERLVTRFQCGLLAQVLPPDIETKIAIVQKKGAEKKCMINNEVANFIAENSGDDVRSLEGLLNKVIFAASLMETDINLNLAMEALSLSSNSDSHEDAVTATVIINTVCNFYKISKNDLLGKKKNKELVEPRQICTYLMTELLDLPLVSIGQAMGGKDHTTIIYTRDKIAGLIKTNPRVATEVSDLKNLILKK